MGINLGDPIFRGIYHGKRAHEDDFDGVLKRAVDAGCVKLMVTGSDLVESKNAVKIAQEHRKRLLSQKRLCLGRNWDVARALLTGW